MTSTSTGRRIGSLVLRGLLTALFVAAGGMKLVAVPFEVAGFAHFGYPLWFMYVVGAAQLLGAALLWRRATVAYGALLLAAVMVGAAFSHLRAGDPVAMAVPAIAILGLLLGLAYARRGDAIPASFRVSQA